MIEEHHFPLHADWRVERLSPAGKQLVGICRAIQHGSSLLIFDEPTSSLSGAETEEVFRIVRTLRARGMGVIYITHRLEELRAIGDRVTILRDGATVHTGPLAEVSTDRIIQHMVGREMVSIYQRQPVAPGAERAVPFSVSIPSTRGKSLWKGARRRSDRRVKRWPRGSRWYPKTGRRPGWRCDCPSHTTSPWRTCGIFAVSA